MLIFCLNIKEFTIINPMLKVLAFEFCLCHMHPERLWDSLFTLVYDSYPFICLSVYVFMANQKNNEISDIWQTRPLLYIQVWEESSGESLLQIQLLTSLENLVLALGNQSPICYPVLLPILQKGIDINGPDELNLLEDSMLVHTWPKTSYFIFITINLWT